MTDLAELEAAGGLVPEEPVPRSISWALNGGEPLTYDIWIKQLGLGEIERLYTKSRALGDDERSIGALWISHCVTFGEDAKQRISFRKANRLAPPLGDAMLLAVQEVNGLNREKKA